MSKRPKKPIWVSPEAHAKLKQLSEKTGRNLLDLATDIILEACKPKPKARESKSTSSKHMGGVWMV